MKIMKGNHPRLSAEVASVKFALAEADESAGTFRGLASVFGAPIDTYPPSIISPGAFAKTLAEQGSRVKILWQHDVTEPIGKPISLKETPSGLEMVGRLDPIELGYRVMTQIKSGTLTDLSIGFDPLKWDMKQDMPGSEPIRDIKEVRLWEVSVVTFGAQRAAQMQAFAVAFRDLPVGENMQWDAAGAASRVRAWAQDDQERLSRAFLTGVGSGNECRFQIADVVDGRLVVVPQAVFAAAMAITGEAELPQRVVDYAKEHLSAYYHKMGLSAPWERNATRIALEPLASIPAEGFEGKVLSNKNRDLVHDAVKALKALLESAGVGMPEEEPAEQPNETPMDEVIEQVVEKVADTDNEDDTPTMKAGGGRENPAVVAGAPEAEEALAKPMPDDKSDDDDEMCEEEAGKKAMPFVKKKVKAAAPKPDESGDESEDEADGGDDESAEGESDESGDGEGDENGKGKKPPFVKNSADDAELKARIAKMEAAVREMREQFGLNADPEVATTNATSIVDVSLRLIEMEAASIGLSLEEKN